MPVAGQTYNSPVEAVNRKSEDLLPEIIGDQGAISRRVCSPPIKKLTLNPLLCCVVAQLRKYATCRRDSQTPANPWDRGLLERRKGITEKKMSGGLAFMLHGKMFCGVLKDDLVVRVGPGRYEKALSRAHARPMDFTGR